MCSSDLGVPCALSEVFAKGGEGGKALAEQVLKLIESAPEGGCPIRYTYPAEASLTEKIEAVCKNIYRADGVTYSPAAKKALDEFTALGYGSLPVCIAKTQYSFSDDPSKLGAPEGFTVTIKNVKVSAGANFLVALTGDIMTMPGLPKSPAAERIDVDENGVISGLF